MLGGGAGAASPAPQISFLSRRTAKPRAAIENISNRANLVSFHNMSNYSQTLPNWLAQRAAVLPDHPALIVPGERWAFAELDRQASDMARALLAQGAAPGDRVALLLRNSPEFAVLVHAAPRAAVALVPLNTRLSAPE